MMILYAVSSDKNFLHLTSAVLARLEIKVEIFKDKMSLYNAVEGKVPFVILFDHEGKNEKEIFEILQGLESHWSKIIIPKILVHGKKATLRKTEFINKGIDHFLSKPINMLELLAYLCSTERLQLKCSTRVNYEVHASVIETLTKLYDYLLQHVKEPVQRFIDFKVSKDQNERKLKEYLVVSRRSAIEVLAAIRSVNEELQSLISKSENDYNLDNLSRIFEKNLVLANAAYNVDYEGSKLAER